MNWLGLDVGGANLKLANARDFARSVPFPLWKKPHELASAIGALISQAPSVGGIAVTMTGELADCFETKTEGVLHILNAVEQAADSRQTAVYQVDGRFVAVESARDQPLLSAASNWHVLARFACRWVSKFPAVLIDVGSTTTDIIPLTSEGPFTISTTDTDRLRRGELVYSGIGRTPVAAVTSVLPYRDSRCPVAAETFATTADVAVLLRFVPEQPHFTDTADGRPLTRNYCRDRLARMICADRESFNNDDAIQAARFVWDRQAKRIGEALRQVISVLPTPPKSFLLCGSGERLAAESVNAAESAAPMLRLSECIGEELSNVAPAHAVAVLAEEWSAKL